MILVFLNITNLRHRTVQRRPSFRDLFPAVYIKHPKLSLAQKIINWWKVSSNLWYFLIWPLRQRRENALFSFIYNVAFEKGKALPTLQYAIDLSSNNFCSSDLQYLVNFLDSNCGKPSFFKITWRNIGGFENHPTKLLYWGKRNYHPDSN